MNKLRIKKLGVLSVAKMYAVMAFIISLLIAIPYGLFIIVFSLIGAAGASGQSSEGALALGGGARATAEHARRRVRHCRKRVRARLD